MSSKSLKGGIQFTGSLSSQKLPAFRFKLTRGDGEALGLGKSVSFSLKDSLDTVVGASYSYNAETGYWKIVLDDPSNIDPDGYWVSYDCADGIETQYPYRYKTADKKAVTDLIDPGTYDDTIPYWKVENQTEALPIGCDDYECQHDVSTPIAFSADGAARIYYIEWRDVLELGGTWRTKKYKVTSSIPYEVSYGVGRETAYLNTMRQPNAAGRALADDCPDCPFEIACYTGGGATGGMDVLTDSGWSVSKDDDTIKNRSSHTESFEADLSGRIHYMDFVDQSNPTWTYGDYVCCKAPCGSPCTADYTFECTFDTQWMEPVSTSPAVTIKWDV